MFDFLLFKSKTVLGENKILFVKRFLISYVKKVSINAEIYVLEFLFRKIL